MCLGQFLMSMIKERKKEKQIKKNRKISKDDIIKILAAKLSDEWEDFYCPIKHDKLKCTFECYGKVTKECWIAWAEEQVKNGT